ncbi:MAG: hypothetical protein J6U01_09750 [Clostridia bacterium]|nr:hypothetical protein [Clostridia bacterium]
MSEISELIDSRTCAVCGKEIEILYPHLWRYKRGNKVMCSWSCLRKFDNGKEAKTKMTTLTTEQKRKACEMALEGENPLPYLKKAGARNPTTAWDTCRKWAEKEWDEEYVDQLPLRFGQPKKAESVIEQGIDKIYEAEKKAQVELVYDPSIKEEYRREQAQKEANERVKDERLRYLWTTAAIRNEYLGVFYYDKKYNTVDWRHPAGEEISLPPADWNLLANALPEIMRTLGVDQQEIEKEV